MLVDTLRAAPGTLPIAAQALLGRRLPVDPAPLPAAGSARYFAPTAHVLAGPFLAFWRAQGGLAVLGFPRSEPFDEQGHAQQFTERFCWC